MEHRLSPLALGLLGLLAGLAASILLGAFTPIGVGGLARAFASNLFDKDTWLSALPYFVPIAASAAGLALAYRAGFITIGAEGQVILGATAAYWMLYYVLGGSSSVGALVAGVLVGGVVGMLYGGLVGALRVYLGVNEILSSLMLNYVAIGIVNYLVAGPWQQAGYTRTAMLPPGQSISLWGAVAIAVAMAVGLELLLLYTRHGVAVDTVRLSRRTAKTYGISVGRTLLGVSLIQGLVAGIGGSVLLLQLLRQLRSIGLQGWGYGYMGILAAWLGGLRPLGAVAASMLIALLYALRSQLQLYGVSDSFVLALEAVIVLFVLAFTSIRGRRG